MKIKYLGTAAAEAFPAIFCNCKYCEEARELGGKNIRTRSQSLVNDDLLIPENWSFTEPRPFAHFTEELEKLPFHAMTIEGTLVVDREGKLLNIMRFGKYQTALVYGVDTENHEAQLSFLRCMKFPANYSKFMIKYDKFSDAYYSVATRVYDPEHVSDRNLLSLLCSKDLETWTVVCDLLDFRSGDREKIGFQYVDFEFEGDDIIFLCRTALNNAHNFHDANYSTFHTIKNFRDIGKGE